MPIFGSFQNIPSLSEFKPASQKRHIQCQQNYRLFDIQSKPCSFCKLIDHWLTGCSKFQAMNIENRFVKAKKLGLCRNCLSEGHVCCEMLFKKKGFVFITSVTEKHWVRFFND